MILDRNTENLVHLLFAGLKERGWTLSSCESLTAGQFGASLCCVPGASEFYLGGAITYCDKVKEAVGVSHDTLEKKTAISKECAEEMAQAALKLTGSDWAVSFTGNAGPTAQDGAPVGCVFIGIAYSLNGKSYAHAVCYQMEGDRNDIRNQCVNEGLRLLISDIGDAIVK